MQAARYSLGAVAVFYLIAVVTMYLAQRQLQYFPTHKAPDPAAVGLSGIQVIDLQASDGVQSLLWYAPPAPGMPTILFFHGNAGEVADRAPRLRAYRGRGFGVAFMSYRGFGASTAAITEAGLIADAVAAHDWLRTQGTPADHIVLVGESLGTGVAVQLAVLRPVAGVALAAPYTATVDVAAELYPWLPVRLLMKDQFRSDLAIPQITAPILIQHGDADQVIPFVQGERLASLARSKVIFTPLPDRGHEALFEPDSWEREMDFFARLTGG